ncbi:hypothetical protein B0T10DRAFT_481078 [Thelonectria olida]|uniref:NAD(P)-binding domain-containing protein n=1 Tax=Thelonectria olida TaxID=1576542 RepID=A0A9P8W9A7_9HYPO|nr:hypothetical protein B0T10DRAFT_481078 [Thelonectria olida]
MKVIVAGATGFVATEVIRQALSNRAITSLVALARRPTPLPETLAPNSETKKFKSVVCDDFNNYPEAVKEQIAGADAVIWLIAITPSKSKLQPWDEVRKVCHDYTRTGLETMSQLHGDQKTAPLRFIYTSGANAQRDPSKKPWVLGGYCLMRGEVESTVINYAKESGGRTNGIVIKAGWINTIAGPNIIAKAIQTVGRSIISLPVLRVDEIAAALIHLAIYGSDKDTLLNDEIAQLGQTALEEEKATL